jgi:hypothetical protein
LVVHVETSSGDLRGSGKQKSRRDPAASTIDDLSSDHMTKGRRRLESGTSSKPVRAHVQNSAFAVNGAVLRITINGAPLFDRTIMPDPYTMRQGI